MSSISYIVFMLNNEEYGIEILYAQEIIRIPNQISQIPNMPSYIEGVINLRGKVITVINLSKRFGFEETKVTLESRLLIVELDNTMLALIVEDVSEIISFEDSSIEKLSSVISQIGNNSLKGIGKIDKRLIILLDASKLKTEVFQQSIGMEKKDDSINGVRKL